MYKEDHNRSLYTADNSEEYHKDATQDFSRSIPNEFRTDILTRKEVMEIFPLLETTEEKIEKKITGSSYSSKTRNTTANYLSGPIKAR
jgi:hypothetical protein